MKKFLITPLFVLLSACVTPGPGPVDPVNVLPINVQNAFKSACGIVIQANQLAPIVGMFTSFDVSQYTSIAAQFCSSFQPLSSISPTGKRLYAATIRGYRVVGVKVR